MQRARARGSQRGSQVGGDDPIVTEPAEGGILMLADIEESHASRVALVTAWRDYGSQVGRPAHPRAANSVHGDAPIESQRAEDLARRAVEALPPRPPRQPHDCNGLNFMFNERVSRPPRVFGAGAQRSFAFTHSSREPSAAPATKESPP